MRFTFEFYRIRPGDDAHAMLDRVSRQAPDLDVAKVTAKSLFATLDMPQAPDGVRILDEGGTEVCSWRPAEP